MKENNYHLREKTEKFILCTCTCNCYCCLIAMVSSIWPPLPSLAYVGVPLLGILDIIQQIFCSPCQGEKLFACCVFFHH